ncbi:MAG: acyl carrier protein [Eubacterium sp.]|nr:acyl carrier protein [Eubacterium sp.]
MRFEELEIDSLVYVQMIVELEELFHCEFPDKFLLLLENEKTIEEFIKEMEQQV